VTGPVDELHRSASAIAAAPKHACTGNEHVLLAMVRQSDSSFARRLLDEVGATEELSRWIEEVSIRGRRPS